MLCSTSLSSSGWAKQPRSGCCSLPSLLYRHLWSWGGQGWGEEQFSTLGSLPAGQEGVGRLDFPPFPPPNLRVKCLLQGRGAKGSNPWHYMKPHEFKHGLYMNNYLLGLD